METRRVLWFMSLVFSVVLLVQYIELPYGYVLSSLLSLGKSQVTSSNGATNLVNQTSFRGAKTNATSGLQKEHDLRPETSNNSDNSAGDSNDHSSSNFLGTNIGLVPEMAGYMGRNQTTRVEEPATNMEKPSLTRSDLATFVNNFSITTNPANTKRFKGPPAIVVPISEMNNMLIKSRVSFQSMKSKRPSEADKELLNAKILIESAEKKPQIDVTSVYRNYPAFLRSYELMEQTLKIYTYAEGERPIFHQPELNGIYASEGWFMKQLQENKQFVTENPDKAHLYYLPFSSHVLQEVLYVPSSHSRKNLVRYLNSYLHNITTIYPFWNRASGADHFLVACHDWAPAETSRIMKNCIRALCNADIKGGFVFSKDVSLPETYIRNATEPLKNLGGKPPSQRHVLAFFAGKMHGYLRPVLLSYWENKDPDIKIFGKLNEQMSYIQYMKSSKYCISARGYEAYTPRVVEAIFYECVPVIIGDNYVPPFFEMLNWESFAVFILEKDIPKLKTILASIPQQRYIEMQERVKQVQKHFLWHLRPVKFDVFHMILHSIWYTRVFQMTS
ncbi:hypothetical protein ACS0TY_012411 [Phlomoides rotata]